MTNCNITVTGQVTDNLSGVASLQAQQDNGDFTAVAFDGAGHFSFMTMLPMDSSAAGSHTVHFRATDSAGNVSPLVDESFTLMAGGFQPGLAGWTVAESGGSATGHGTVVEDHCDAVMREGDSFNVTLTHTFTVPAQLSVLTFTYADLSFEPAPPNVIQDAFEAALLDSNSKPLVHTIAPGRDAFFNLTHGQPAALGADTTQQDQAVTVDLSGLTPGSSATLVLRLVNNDGSPNTSVHISTVQVLSGGRGAPLSVTPPVEPRGVPQRIDFSILSDVSASFQPQYGRTAFDDDTHVLHADLLAQNTGHYLVDAPLLVGIIHISDPTIRVQNADGVTPDGIPYYDFSAVVPGGTLLPGQQTGSRSLAFFNPGRVPFTYDLVFLGQLNQNPAFTSQPVLQGNAGRPYVYQAQATDPDKDRNQLTFSLLAGPSGMTVDKTTGNVTWSPATADIGTHNVALRVDGGRGGSAEQDYVLTVPKDMPNQPPVFTSLPVVDGNVNTAYSYQATATDPDGDPLTFSVLNGPQQLSIDPHTGLVTWTPTADQAGPNNVTLQVDDGRGGTATQVYTIALQQEAGNLPPVIITTPPTSIAVPRGVTFADSTFNNADWELAVFSDTGGTTVAGQQMFGGNPGAFRQITDNITAASGPNSVSAVWSFHGKISATYSPQTQGAIFTLDYSEDSILLFNSDGGTQGELAGIALRQDGQVYVSHGFITPEYSWVHHDQRNLTANNFGLLRSNQMPAGSGNQVDFTQHPDFSVNGTTIEFGFFRANANSPGGGAYTITGGIDNWSVTIPSGFPNPLGTYTYNAKAIDPDGDKLTYSLKQGPQGMSIDPNSGVVQWQLLPNTLTANAVTFFDGTFNSSDWDRTTLMHGNGGTISSTQES
jgi:hypothetical protein